jgi:hypothetical protein
MQLFYVPLLVKCEHGSVVLCPGASGDLFRRKPGIICIKGNPKIRLNVHPVPKRICKTRILDL